MTKETEQAIKNCSKKIDAMEAFLEAIKVCSDEEIKSLQTAFTIESLKREFDNPFKEYTPKKDTENDSKIEKKEILKRQIYILADWNEHFATTRTDLIQIRENIKLMLSILNELEE